MRASGKDITELFGYAPDDTTAAALALWKKNSCPFVPFPCSKTNHDQSLIYGTCSVTHGINRTPGTEIVICPRRLYADNYSSLRNVAKEVWPESSEFIIGGTSLELRTQALKSEKCVIAFGQNSGNEIHVEANGSLSFDWILQSYRRHSSATLQPVDWAAVEVQSIDTTTNYRDNWSAYSKIKNGEKIGYVPQSEHGLNWANVHKRLIPQIVRKGNIVRTSPRCVGFFFVVPYAVYEKFKEVIGPLKEYEKPARDRLSVITYKLGPEVDKGKIRNLEKCGPIHYSLDELALSFIRNCPEDAAKAMDQKIRNLL